MEDFEKFRELREVVTINAQKSEGGKLKDLTDEEINLALHNSFPEGVSYENSLSVLLVKEMSFRIFEKLKSLNDVAQDKAKPKYLFTTDDGVKMFEGDVWWSVVYDGVRKPKETKSMEYKGDKPFKNVGTFSTKGLAYKAALEGFESEGLVSLNDINIYIGQLDRLEDVAKRRYLNKHIPSVKVTRDTPKYSENDIIKYLSLRNNIPLTPATEKFMIAGFNFRVKK